MARLVRATCRGTVLVQVARTSRAMTDLEGRTSIFRPAGITPVSRDIHSVTGQDGDFDEPLACPRSKRCEAQGEPRPDITTLPHWMVENLAHVEVWNVKHLSRFAIDFPDLVLFVELTDRQLFTRPITQRQRVLHVIEIKWNGRQITPCIKFQQFQS
jgi:hypothetical protein